MYCTSVFGYSVHTDDADVNGKFATGNWFIRKS